MEIFNSGLMKRKSPRKEISFGQSLFLTLCNTALSTTKVILH